MDPVFRVSHSFASPGSGQSYHMVLREQDQSSLFCMNLTKARTPHLRIEAGKPVRTLGIQDFSLPTPELPHSARAEIMLFTSSSSCRWGMKKVHLYIQQTCLEFSARFWSEYLCPICELKKAAWLQSILSYWDSHKQTQPASGSHHLEDQGTRKERDSWRILMAQECSRQREKWVQWGEINLFTWQAGDSCANLYNVKKYCKSSIDETSDLCQKRKMQPMVPLTGKS